MAPAVKNFKDLSQSSAHFSQSLNKNQLREELKATLKLHPPTQENQTSLCARLIRVFNSSSGTWASFKALGSEPDLSFAVEQLPQINWVYPRVVGPELHFYRADSNDQFQRSVWGILEPDPRVAMKVELEDIDGFLVPGMAFDQNCARLGRGRGYYDRTLFNAKNRTTNKNQDSKPMAPISIGVAFDQQVLAEPLPAEPHDVVMNFVLTDKRFFAPVGQVSDLESSLAALSSGKD